MKKGCLFIVSLFFIPIIFWACVGPKQLNTNQTYLQIKPLEPLPVYDLESIPVNLDVTIENVADMTSSYKNHAALYLNDYLIQPEQEISNIQDTYHYRLKLQPGIYDIKGEYYALDGFTERKYVIRPQTKVMIKPETLTTVYCKIEKGWDGTPLHNPLLFAVSYQLFANVAKQPAATENKPAPERKSVIKALPEEPQPETKNLITLQIDTEPTGADVSVDDQFLGKSPVRVLVDRDSDHTLLLTLTGYDKAVKILDHSQFGSEKVLHFLHKLAPSTE